MQPNTATLKFIIKFYLINITTFVVVFVNIPYKFLSNNRNTIKLNNINLFLCERKYFFCGVRFSFLVYLLYHCELTTPLLRMKPLNSPKGFLYSGRILSKGHTMNIYTVTGQIVKTDLIKDNVSSYDIPQGIYIVELSSTNGKSAKKVQVRQQCFFNWIFHNRADADYLQVCICFFRLRTQLVYLGGELSDLRGKFSDLRTRMFDLRTRMFDLVGELSDLGARMIDIKTRKFDLRTRTFDLRART